LIQKLDFKSHIEQAKYGTTLNQSLEKVAIIGINLFLLVSVGLPLLFTTTEVIIETEQSLRYQHCIQEIDEAILLADQNRIPITKEIAIPVNLTLKAEFNQLIFKYYLDGWFVISRSYRCYITVDGFNQGQVNLLHVNANDTTICLQFEPP
jgi:hypothetical protein